MTFAGVDVGTQSVKLVILRDSNILFSSITVTEEEGVIASQHALEEGLRTLNLSLAELSYIVSTGVGRASVPFANRQRSQEICHATGGYFLMPSARTVLDIGAGGGRAMRLSEDGKLENFAQNSKCAAGTGAFLEAMTNILEMPLEEMAQRAAKAKRRAKISSYCAVFAESEVISNIHKGKRKGPIAAGIHWAVADRLVELLNKVGIKEDVVLTGGVAKNIGVVKALEEKLGLKMKVVQEPQIVGALGAALIAQNLGQ